MPERVGGEDKYVVCASTHKMTRLFHPLSMQVQPLFNFEGGSVSTLIASSSVSHHAAGPKSLVLTSVHHKGGKM
jgi:hypothetical protein